MWMKARPPCCPDQCVAEADFRSRRPASRWRADSTVARAAATTVKQAFAKHADRCRAADETPSKPIQRRPRTEPGLKVAGVASGQCLPTFLQRGVAVPLVSRTGEAQRPWEHAG
jgi:hypothetical protein